MLLSRDDLITTLFRETDRAQRLKTGLAVIFCGIAGSRGWRAGRENCEFAEIDQEITARIVRLLRCYDSLGRFGNGEYCLILPGCNSFNAVGMAERLRERVFGSPLLAKCDCKVEASFGVAGSGGRSPLVVLRNAQHALRSAIDRGPGSIVRSSYDAEPDSINFPIVSVESGTPQW